MSSLPSLSLLLVTPFLLVTPLLLLLPLVLRISRKPRRRNTAVILVLGDIGRSPRMMYHASSLALHGWDTFIIGYGDTLPIPALLDSPHVHLLHLSNPPKRVSTLPWILRAPMRIAYQVVSVLFLCLWKVPFRAEVMLVQNPPSIPTLALAQLLVWLEGTRLIIDWHNTGYSILSMRVGPMSLLVRLARWCEATFGRRAYAHLFVTRALKDFLVEEWKLRSVVISPRVLLMKVSGRTVVLHDRPPSHFRKTEASEQHELFRRLDPDFHPLLPPSFIPPHPDSTTFTHVHSNSLAALSPTRPALVVSSTSWTADEDFSLLLTALDHYADVLASSPALALPKLLVLVTGKGALRPAFEHAVRDREAEQWEDVAVRCTFVSARDYPRLLGCADIGVSLHASSSGRDLPMKVVDMFGCRVPVLAKGFGCVGELVKEGRNGRVFDTGEELGKQMVDVLEGFPRARKLEALRSYFSGEARGTLESDEGEEGGDDWSTWDEHWDRVMYSGVLRGGHDR